MDATMFVWVHLVIAGRILRELPSTVLCVSLSASPKIKVKWQNLLRHRCRSAGYYTTVFLWGSFVLWLIMNVLMVTVPRYGAYTMTLTGLTMLFSTAIYYWMLPDRQLRIHIEDVQAGFFSRVDLGLYRCH